MSRKPDDLSLFAEFPLTTRFPELQGMEKPARLLHPQPAQGVPEAGISKIAGPTAWPRGEPWPVCPTSGGEEHLPIPVVQLRRCDFPEIQFPDGREVLQILWCPQLH